MKVCIITPFFYPVKGGVESHVFFTAQGLAERGYDVEVVTSDSAKSGRIAEAGARVGKIKVRRLRTLLHIGKFSPVFPEVFSYVRKSDADLFHIHNYRHPTNMIPFLTKKPCVLTPHWPDYPRGLRSSWNDWLVPLFDRLVGRRIIRRFKKVCAVSEPEKEWVQEKLEGRAADIIVTPNGVARACFIKKVKKVVRKRLDVKSSQLVVLAVGRLHASKGFDQIVQIAEDFADVVFVIIGPDDGFRTQLEVLIKERSIQNVRLLGEVSEEQKWEWYSAADVFVHPSHYEAFGISVLEAMAQRLPVVVTQVGALPWLVGNAGLLFEDKNRGDLKKQLSKLLESQALRRTLATRAFKKARRFTWEATVSKIDRLYKEIQP